MSECAAVPQEFDPCLRQIRDTPADPSAVAIVDVFRRGVARLGRAIEHEEAVAAEPWPFPWYPEDDDGA